MEFRLPKLGEKIEFAQVVKVLVRVGDSVQKDQPVAELETDKAVVELPSPTTGTVKEIHIKEGGKISIGAPVLTLDPKGGGKGDKVAAVKPKEALPTVGRRVTLPPSQRRLAGERDLHSEEGILPDFSKWGPIEQKPMSPLRLKTSQAMATAWSVIPHVTQFDEADITSLVELQKQNGKPSLTVIIVKISSEALKQFPQFNASVDLKKEEIVFKKYFHIGIAVDTGRGLLVPVLRDADKKSISTIARELAELASRAREKKLRLDEMEGATFTVTNLGGIGGGYFTPIIHHPEVAILGVGRATQKPVWSGEKWKPRLVLPLSISYDHRVIDGADAARFLRFLVALLEAPETLAWG